MHYRKLVIKIFTQKILTLIPFNPKTCDTIYFYKMQQHHYACILILTGFAQTPVIPNKPISNNPVRNTKIQPVASNSGVDRYLKSRAANDEGIGQSIFAVAICIQTAYWPRLPWAAVFTGIGVLIIRMWYYQWPGQKLDKRNLMWRKIPSQAVYGRWEISLLPFPPGYDPSFSGIIRSGLIETHGSDSVYFILNYLDNANNKRNWKRKAVCKTKTTFPTQKDAVPINPPLQQDLPAELI